MPCCASPDQASACLGCRALLSNTFSSRTTPATSSRNSPDSTILGRLRLTPAALPQRSLHYFALPVLPHFDGPFPSVPRQALPALVCVAKPGPSRLAMNRRKLPSITSPAMPVQTQLRHASPALPTPTEANFATPCPSSRAAPDRASPLQTKPSPVTDATTAFPGLVTPLRTTPSPSCRSKPNLAPEHPCRPHLSCRAAQRRATPHKAYARLAFPAVLRRRAPSLATPILPGGFYLSSSLTRANLPQPSAEVFSGLPSHSPTPHPA